MGAPGIAIGLGIGIGSRGQAAGGGAPAEANAVIAANGDEVVTEAGDAVVADDGEPEIVGVPLVEPDFALTGKEFWDLEAWANPAGAAYRSRASVATWPSWELVGANDDLQAALDAVPDGTTLVLADGGDHGRVELVGRRRLAVVAESPLGATWAGMDYLGHEFARHYNAIVVGGETTTSWVSLLLGAGTGAGTAEQRAEAAASWFDPPGNLIVRDVDFVSDGSIVYYQKQPVAPSGGWTTNHWYANAALGFRHVSGVLVEGCRFSGYTYGTDNSAAAPNDPQENFAGPAGHPGVVWGNAGIFNVCVRDNDFQLATNAGGFGSCWAVFFDGARFVQTVGNAVTGKSHTGMVLHLTNDDYTLLWGEPLPTIDFGARNSHHDAVAHNTFDVWGQVHTAITGGNSYVGHNAWVLPPANYSLAAGFTSRCSRYHYLGHVYDHRFSCVEHNTAAGAGVNFANFVGLDPWGGYQCGTSDPDYEFRGIVGAITIEENVVGGTVTKWYHDGYPGDTEVPAEPSFATHNTDAAGARDGV